MHNESTMTEYVVLPDPVSSSDENVLLLGSKALWHKALCVPLAVPLVLNSYRGEGNILYYM